MMLFRPLDFLHLARYLYSSNLPVTNISEEAVFRTVIGKAYYGIFLHARERVSSKTGWRPSHTSKDHKDVRDSLIRLGLKQAADRLKHLRNMRNIADYDLHIDIVRDDAMDALKIAEEVLIKIEGV